MLSIYSVVIDINLCLLFYFISKGISSQEVLFINQLQNLMDEYLYNWKGYVL